MGQLDGQVALVTGAAGGIGGAAVLKRNGLGRLGRIGLEPAVRYER